MREPSLTPIPHSRSPIRPFTRGSRRACSAASFRYIPVWVQVFTVALALSDGAGAEQEAAVIRGAVRVAAAAPAKWAEFQAASEAHELAVVALREAAPTEWVAVEAAAERAWMGDAGCERPPYFSVQSCVGTVLAEIVGRLRKAAPTQWAAVEAAASREQDARRGVETAAPEAWAELESGLVVALNGRGPMHVAGEALNAAANALEVAAPAEAARYAEALAAATKFFSDAAGWSDEEWEQAQERVVMARARLEAVAPTELAIWEAARSAQSEALDVRGHLWRLLLPR